MRGSFERNFRRDVLAVCLLIACATAARAHDPAGSEPPGFHGMLVVGSETIYMSHLPMFHPQHRYQGLWEVSFGKLPDGRDADALYRQERGRPENAGRIFTLAPREVFRLPELATGELPRSSFKADLFLGHFERAGRRLLLSDVTVHVQDRVHWHPFRTSHARPGELTYVLFGNGEERFLSHWISVVPSYHQILAVAPATEIGEVGSAQFVVPGRSEGEPLKAGESVTGLLILNGDPEQPAAVRELALEVTSQFFLEDRELAESFLE